MNAQELATTLMEKQKSYRLGMHTKTWYPSATPATSLGYECERRTCYQRVWPDKAAPIEAELASIFEEGNYHQTNVRNELACLGFEVVESETTFRDEVLQIVGSIDGKIAVDAVDAVASAMARHGRIRLPLEIKSTMGGSPETQEAWKNSENKLLKRYYAQFQTYLYLTNSPEGVALFKNKATGLWTVCPVSLDYEYAEKLLKRAERIRDAVSLIKSAPEEDRELLFPPRILNRSECDGCAFRDTVCHPAEAEVDPLLVSQDVDLLKSLEEREALDKSATRFDAIDKAIKSRFKTTKGDRFVIGEKFLVTKKTHGKGIRIDIQRLNSEAPDIV